MPKSDAISSSAQRKSRGTDAQDRGVRLEYPPLEHEACAYLISYLLDVGAAHPGPMSAAALTNLELQAWQANKGIELNAWESSTLIIMSRAFVETLSEASNQHCPPPFQSVSTEVRVTIPDRLEAALSGFRRGAKGARNEGRKPRV